MGVNQHYEAYNARYWDKTNIPVYLFLSGAGTGKSRNAMEFHKTVIHCLPDGELRQRLKNAWTFHVSLENGTTWRQIEEPSPYRAIGTRMMKQLLQKDLDEIISTYEQPTPWEVLQLVAKYHEMDLRNVTVILVVDGLQNTIDRPDDRFDQGSQFYQTLSAIGDLALKGTFLLPCCTATISGPVSSFLKSSPRHRILLPLPSLHSPTFLKDGIEEGVFKKDYILDILVNDCGGHGRALEALEDALNGREIQDCNVDNLMNDLRYKLTSRYPDTLSLTITEAQAVARAILTRQLVNADECLPGTNKTPPQITRPGLIRFNQIGGTSQTGILEAPYVWIWILVHQVSGEHNSLLRDWRFSDYGEHRSTLNSSSPPGSQFWENFEHFVAAFRCLKSRVLGEGEPTTIQRVHAGARFGGSDFNFVNHYMDLQIAIHRQDTRSESHQSSPWNIGCKDGTTIDISKYKHCVINAPGAPAGDFFLCLDHRNTSDIITEVGQCKKWSKGTGSSLADVFNKERGKSASGGDFFILYSTREWPAVLGKNSAVVDSKNWNEYFGPFAGRAFNFASVGPLDINTAAPVDLRRVGGIDEDRAEKIISKRPFKDFKDAMEKTGIPEQIAKRFRFSG